MINTREYYQSTAVELFKEHPMLLLEWATGMGKTLALLKCIESDESGIEWYIITPEIMQVDNLYREIKKWGYEWMLGSKIRDIICYASFKTLTGARCNLSFNEVHRLSDLKENIAETVKYEKIIADSATVPLTVKERLLLLGEFYTYKVSLRDAIEGGILPEPKVYVHYTYPDDVLKRNIVTTKSGSIRFTDAGYVRQLDRIIKDWINKGSAIEASGRNGKWCFMKANIEGSRRKLFIASTKSSTIKEFIASQMGGKRFICYTASIEQCDYIGGELAIHSKRKKGDREDMINAFNSYNSSQLYTNKMGREGLNLEGIEVVIISQLSSGRDEGLELIQSIGRGLRGVSPEVHLFVAKGTVDQKYLSKALLTINNKNITYINEKAQKSQSQKGKENLSLPQSEGSK